MTEDEKRQSQLALIYRVLDRPDLNRGQRVVFLDMRIALSDKGVILSDAQERQLTSIIERPAPDPEKSQAVLVPKAWQPMSSITIALWVGGAVLAIMVCQFCLTFLLHWLGWR
jgi:hypothetical protein